MARVYKNGGWQQLDSPPPLPPLPSYFQPPVPIEIDIPGDEDWMKGASASGRTLEDLESINKHLTENHGPLDQWKHGRRRGGRVMDRPRFTYPRQSAWVGESGWKPGSKMAETFGINPENPAVAAHAAEIRDELKSLFKHDPNWNGKVRTMAWQHALVANGIKQPECHIELRNYGWRSDDEIDGVLFHEMIHAFSMPNNYDRKFPGPVFQRIRPLEEGMTEALTQLLRPGKEISYKDWVGGIYNLFSAMGNKGFTADEKKQREKWLVEWLSTPHFERPQVIRRAAQEAGVDPNRLNNHGKYIWRLIEMQDISDLAADERTAEERAADEMAVIKASAPSPTRSQVIALLTKTDYQSFSQLAEAIAQVAEYGRSHPDDTEIHNMGESLLMLGITWSADLDNQIAQGPVAKHITENHGPLDQWKHGRRRGHNIRLGYEGEGMGAYRKLGPADPTDFDQLSPSFQKKVITILDAHGPSDWHNFESNLDDIFAKTNIEWEWFDRDGNRHVENLRDVGRQWYRRAHDEVAEIAHKYPIRKRDGTLLQPHEYVAMTAAVSPQMRWEANLLYAEQIAKFLSQNPRLIDRPGLRNVVSNVPDDPDLRLTDLDDENIGWALRHLIAEEGRKYHNSGKGTGGRLAKPQGISGNRLNLAIAIATGTDSYDNLLNGHKVRSFYNNILDPDFTGPTTIDTHAMGAAFRVRVPGGGKTAKRLRGGQEVNDNAKETYSMFVKAYRNRARAHGLAPHEFQAIIWIWWQYYSDKEHYPIAKAKGWIP